MANPRDFNDFATEYPNYFPGQYLLAEDFELQHKYLSDRLRYHNQSLHVSGIIEGLEVTAQDGTSVEITPGSAIDNQGNLIVLKEKATYSEFNGLEEGELYIQYEKNEADKQQDKVEESNTRWKENPIFGFGSYTPDGGVKLARLEISGTEIQIDESIREYSGLSLPNSNGQTLTLRSGGNPNLNLAVLTGSLKIDGDLQLPKVNFNEILSQKINLYEKRYGIGIQQYTQYFRTDKNFAWYKGGQHNDDELDAGEGGQIQMVLKNDGKVGIGEPNPSAKLEVHGEVKAMRFAGVGAIEKGMIIMWSGQESNIPSGWYCCDGQEVNGEKVPDLRARFIVGTGGRAYGGAHYPLGETGGEESIVLTEEMLPAHDGMHKGILKHWHKVKIRYQGQAQDGTDRPLDEVRLESNGGKGWEIVKAKYQANKIEDRVYGKYVSGLTVEDASRQLAHIQMETADSAEPTHPPASKDLPNPIPITPRYYALCFIIYLGV